MQPKAVGKTRLGVLSSRSSRDTFFLLRSLSTPLRRQPSIRRGRHAFPCGGEYVPVYVVLWNLYPSSYVDP